MYKKIFGISILIVLFGILFTNILDQNNTNTIGDYDVSGDTSVNDTPISPHDSVGIEPGEAAPDFELETLEGEPFVLSDLKGKKVILNFWYSYCPPCLEEMPEMQDFYEEYQDEVEIVTVNITRMEKAEEDVRDFINEYEYSFTVPLDRDNHVSDTYQIVAAPITYFIGTDGIVQQPRRVGPMTYDFMVDMMNSLN